MPDEISFAIVLNLHQPQGNLEELLDSSPWDAQQILWALDRIPRSLWRHEGRARVHLSLSGTLLETLSDPAFQQRVYGTVDCGALLWHLQNTSIIDVLGTGYYHPVLPLIPEADREEHLTRWQGIGKHLFNRANFSGFWPPEMGFCMELIPLLRRLGYRYVLVDSEHVEPVGEMSWQELRYRPHVARYGGEEITVVVRDRELSDAQESGMDADWFVHEVYERTKWCDFEPLVVTATDGDNGGWFRETSGKANFWTVFHDTLMERVATGESRGIRPSFIHEYLDRNPAVGADASEVTVRTGAWNTGWHHGLGFTQWTGSAAQRAALTSIATTSAAVNSARADRPGVDVEAALWRLLRAETSCNLYWGEAWVDRCDADLAEALRALPTVPA
jgi:4-alpha-glucanotransferase